MKSTNGKRQRTSPAETGFWHLAASLVLTIGAGCAGFFAGDAMFNKSGNAPYAGPLTALTAAVVVGNASRQSKPTSTSVEAVQPLLEPPPVSKAPAANPQSSAAPKPHICLLATTELPNRPLIQYFLQDSGQTPPCIVVRVRATDVEPFASWRSALKQCAGIQWKKKIYLRELAGRTVLFATGYIRLSEDLSATENALLERNLQSASVGAYSNRRMALAILELSQHSVQHNPQNTLFQECTHFGELQPFAVSNRLVPA